jgi:hypothetical protein
MMRGRERMEDVCQRLASRLRILSMPPIVYVLVPLAILVLAFRIFLIVFGGKKNRNLYNRYYLKQSLFSPAERSFLGVLDSLNMEDCRIMAKVRLADIFEVKTGPGKGGWWGAFNRINAKHVDFLLVRQNDGAPILGIELDDSSHENNKRKKRDAFVDDLFKSVGLPLLHVRVRSHYSPLEIRQMVTEAIDGKSDSNLANARKPEGSRI